MSEQIENWDDLEQLARSENPHERVSAVIKARVRTALFMDGTLMEHDLKKAVDLSYRVFHDTSEYDPSIEEAVAAVRGFFERWKERTDEKQYWGEIIDLARSEKAEERKEAVSRAFEGLRICYHGGKNVIINELNHASEAENSMAILLLRMQQSDYLPTKEEVMVIVEKCRQFKRESSDFAKRHRRD